MDNQKNKNKKDFIVKVILIIIIILLLAYNIILIGKGKKERVLTGNVDIIEIKCEKKDECKNESGNKEPNNGNNGNENNEENPENNEEPELVVYDETITWHENTPARIFTNSMYEMDGIIAPEDSNVYQFIVNNATDMNIKYTINFIETNIYNINMKYKLKKNDTYFVDEYTSIGEINLEEILLNNNSNDTYYLEWKWISSSNDTEIGSNPNAKYGLNIEIKAESINEQNT